MASRVLHTLMLKPYKLLSGDEISVCQNLRSPGRLPPGLFRTSSLGWTQEQAKLPSLVLWQLTTPLRPSGAY